MYKNSILECVGNTPLVKLNNIKNKYNLSFNIFAKLERSNPSGSVKDRAALFIIKEGLKDGSIKPDSIIVEATSGNTGISLAMICASLSMKCVIFMPESASIERRKMMNAYGAEIHLTKASLGMKGAVNEANEFIKTHPNSIAANQFSNPNNVLSHFETTSKEIIADLDGKIDAFIAGFGTSGTLCGTGKGLKEFDYSIEVIGVEPMSSPLITQNSSGAHKIQGIGANFIPGLFDKKYVDRIVTISNEDSYEGARILAKEEGILSGISSGANLMAALKLDNKEYKDKNVVIILSDNGERYLSVDDLFN